MSTTRNQLEVRCSDPTHILTNLRVHATKKTGFDCIRQEHFLKVSEAQPHILPKVYITELVDKQNAAIACQVFSQEVEEVMRELGDDTQANLVQSLVSSL